MNKEMRKNEILTKLMTIEGQVDNNTWRSWIKQAMDYIKEQK